MLKKIISTLVERFVDHDIFFDKLRIASKLLLAFMLTIGPSFYFKEPYFLMLGSIVLTWGSADFMSYRDQLKSILLGVICLCVSMCGTSYFAYNNVTLTTWLSLSTLFAYLAVVVFPLYRSMILLALVGGITTPFITTSLQLDVLRSFQIVLSVGFAILINMIILPPRFQTRIQILLKRIAKQQLQLFNHLVFFHSAKKNMLLKQRLLQLGNRVYSLALLNIETSQSLSNSNKNTQATQIYHRVLQYRKISHGLIMLSQIFYQHPAVISNGQVALLIVALRKCFYGNMESVHYEKYQKIEATESKMNTQGIDSAHYCLSQLIGDFDALKLL